MMESVVSVLDSTGYNGAQYMEWNWLQTDDGYVLCVYIYGFEPDEPGVDLTDDEYEKIEQAISSAFGDIDSGEEDEPYFED